MACVYVLSDNEKSKIGASKRINGRLRDHRRSRGDQVDVHIIFQCPNGSNYLIESEVKQILDKNFEREGATEWYIAPAKKIESAIRDAAKKHGVKIKKATLAQSKPKEERTLNVILTGESFKWLEGYSEKEDRTKGWIVREALDHFRNHVAET